MAEQAPRLSFGIPVRNGAGSLSRCLDSLLAQDFEDFEIVISDNASTDSTREVASHYAARDARIHVSGHDRNQGIIENFNHVVRLSQGEFFRWMGADDWVEPSYASECIRALEAAPDAVAATTNFDLVHEDGHQESVDFDGPRVDSPDPVARLERMLWFFRANPAFFDPIYSLMRRHRLLEAGLQRIHRKNDWLLSAQLSLAGPFVHVDRCLSHRHWPVRPPNFDDELLPKRLHPIRHRELSTNPLRLLSGLMQVLDVAELAPDVRRACRSKILVFCSRELVRELAARAGRFRRERLGLTRDRILGA